VTAAKAVDSKHRSVGLELLSKLGVNVNAAAARPADKASGAVLASAALSVGAWCLLMVAAVSRGATVHSIYTGLPICVCSVLCTFAKAVLGTAPQNTAHADIRCNNHSSSRSSAEHSIVENCVQVSDAHSHLHPLD